MDRFFVDNGMHSEGPPLAEELDHTARLLQEHRPELTVEELDRLERRLFAPARARPRRSPRLVVVVCLALGLVFTTAGTGLAVSGLTSDGHAVRAQHPNGTGGQSGPHPPANARDRHGPVSIQDAARTSASTPAGAALAQAEARTSAPVWYTIPILVAGIGFFGLAAVMRRGRRRALL